MVSVDDILRIDELYWFNCCTIIFYIFLLPERLHRQSGGFLLPTEALSICCVHFVLLCLFSSVIFCEIIHISLNEASSKPISPFLIFSQFNFHPKWFFSVSSIDCRLNWYSLEIFNDDECPGKFNSGTVVIRKLICEVLVARCQAAVKFVDIVWNKIRLPGGMKQYCAVPVIASEILPVWIERDVYATNMAGPRNNNCDMMVCKDDAWSEKMFPGLFADKMSFLLGTQTVQI